LQFGKEAIVDLGAHKVPVSTVDPFAESFSKIRFPLTRNCARPAPRDGCRATTFASRASRRGVLNDWETFCSSRGAGLTAFAKAKLWRTKRLVLATVRPG
jgi:4-methoxybenzoate monooxygenase (O-demethylating)